jgi:DNA gyrase subunit B
MTSEYNASNISVLRGAAAVRQIPGMYIDATDRTGIHHLFKEIFDNAIDESLAGHCNTINVILNKNGSITIKDDGRGIPVDIHPDEGVSAATLVFTELHAGGKFDSDSYKVSGGLHGVGSAVTCALSEYLEFHISREGSVHSQRFEEGIPLGATRIVSECDPSETGTSVTFKPCKKVFSDALEEGGIHFDFDDISEYAKNSSFLIKGLRIIVTSQEGDSKTYFSENGISDLVGSFVREDDDMVVDDIIHFHDDFDEHGASCEISFAIKNSLNSPVIQTYVNNINTREGGKHLQGMRAAFERVINDLEQPDPKKAVKFTAEDFLRGGVFVLSMRLEKAEFGGQTKGRLSSGNGYKVAYALIKNSMSEYLEKNPDIAKKIVAKAIMAQSFREKQEKMTDALKKEESKKGMTAALPGKLAPCRSKDLAINELFIVEGDSAGGSAKQGRDSFCQAILPLKGKILNVEKAKMSKILESQEVATLTSAIGTGFQDGYDYSKLRYGKLIIMTDADDDGLHITTLLLTYFYRMTPDLLKKGHIYIAKPPLYRIQKKGGKTEYKYYVDDDQVAADFPNGVPETYDKQRFKGLGEMNPSQLEETTMKKHSRQLMKVIYNEDMAEKINSKFEMLMGDSNDERKQFFLENAYLVES